MAGRDGDSGGGERVSRRLRRGRLVLSERGPGDDFFGASARLPQRLTHSGGAAAAHRVVGRGAGGLLCAVTGGGLFGASIGAREHPVGLGAIVGVLVQTVAIWVFLVILEPEAHFSQALLWGGLRGTLAAAVLAGPLGALLTGLDRLVEPRSGRRVKGLS